MIASISEANGRRKIRRRKLEKTKHKYIYIMMEDDALKDLRTNLVYLSDTNHVEFDDES